MSEAEIDRALTGLDGWSLTEAGLRRTIEAATFPAAIALVQRVAQVADGLVYLLGPGELDACDGDLAVFEHVLTAALERAHLALAVSS